MSELETWPHVFIHSLSAGCPIPDFVKSNQHKDRNPFTCVYTWLVVAAGDKGAYQIARKKGKALRRGLKVAEAELFYTERQGEVSLKRYHLSRDLKEVRRSHTGLREKVSDKRKSGHSSVVYSRNSQRAWA